VRCLGLRLGSFFFYFFCFGDVIVGDVANIIIDVIIDDSYVESCLAAFFFEIVVPLGYILWALALACIDVADLVTAPVLLLFSFGGWVVLHWGDA
jgi:hypothetical protein